MIKCLSVYNHIDPTKALNPVTVLTVIGYSTDTTIVIVPHDFISILQPSKYFILG